MTPIEFSFFYKYPAELAAEVIEPSKAVEAMQKLFRTAAESLDKREALVVVTLKDSRPGCLEIFIKVSVEGVLDEETRRWLLNLFWILFGRYGLVSLIKLLDHIEKITANFNSAIRLFRALGQRRWFNLLELLFGRPLSNKNVESIEVRYDNSVAVSVSNDEGSLFQQVTMERGLHDIEISLTNETLGAEAGETHEPNAPEDSNLEFGIEGSDEPAP